MNRSIFWRLVWKEYRLQRALWIAMAVLTVLLQVIVVWTVTNATDRVNYVFGLALTLAACYALGCGAVLFAAERETGTFEFQRAIPVSSPRLFAAKVAYALASTLALILMLVIAATFLSGWHLPEAPTHLALWAVMGLGALEVLAWGIFFSLHSARPLLAAILGISVASTVVHMIAWSLVRQEASISYVPTVPYRVVVLALVALADYWLGLRWLSARREVSLGDRLARRRKPMRQAPAAQIAAKPPRSMMFRRLLWQQWRQSRRMMPAPGLLAVVLTFILFWYPGDWAGWYLSGGQFAAVLAAIWAALMGSCVFLGDQSRQRFRFFAEHGARPGPVWLSRQLVWLVPLVVLMVAASLFAWPGQTNDVYRSVSPGYELRLHDEPLEYVLQQTLPLGVRLVVRGIATFTTWALVAYAAGQFCSMLFRSGILAAVFGILLAGLLCGWAWLMRFLSIDWRWSVAPLPVMLLVATRLRTSDWMLERNRFRGWLRVGLVLAVPAVAIVLSVPRVRVSAIAVVPESFASECTLREPTAEERETEAMFERAGVLLRSTADFRRKVEPKPGETPVGPATLPGTVFGPRPKVQLGPGEPAKKPTPRVPPAGSPPLEPWDIAWVKANGESLALTLQATRRPISDAPHRVRWDHRPRGETGLMYLLVRAAEAAQAEGKLDEAMEYHLAALRLSRHIGVYHDARMQPDEWVYHDLYGWVAAPGQTAERLAAMLRELTKVTEPPVSRTLDIQTRYAHIRDLIDGNPTALANARLEKWDAAVIALWNRWLPWERERALRVLDRITYDDLTACHFLEEDILARGRKVQYLYFRDRYGYDGRRPSLTLAFDSYLRRTFDPANPNLELDRIVEDASRRREVRLLLAIEASTLEHGRLPKTLDELVGTYLKDLPHDPYTGEPFRYFPEGLPVPLPQIGFEPHTPFLWNAGTRVRVSDPTRSDFKRYGIIDPSHLPSDGWYYPPPETEQDVWLAGRIVRLPVPQQKVPAGGSPAPHK